MDAERVRDMDVPNASSAMGGHTPIVQVSDLMYEPPGKGDESVPS